MTSLPSSRAVSVPVLASLFGNTTNSYKFLFFQALLALLKNQGGELASRALRLDELAAEMTAIAWYPHKFFRLSFGRQDQMAAVLDALQFNLDATAPGTASAQRHLREAIRDQADQIGLTGILRYVPYRLLEVFFHEELRGRPDGQKNREIRRLSASLFDERIPLYRFEDSTQAQSIEVHPAWTEYLMENVSIVMGWAHWEWLGYLQRRNPSVPALALKLSPPPPARAALIQQKAYWKMVMKLGTVRCIYTGQTLNGEAFALDHFVPWSFVCHDQLWNLVPVTLAANQSKGNQLPHRQYVDPMITLQTRALGWAHNRLASQPRQWDRISEPYLADLHLDMDGLLNAERLHRAYMETIPPLLSLAEQSGFPRDWRLA